MDILFNLLSHTGFRLVLLFPDLKKLSIINYQLSIEISILSRNSDSRPNPYLCSRFLSTGFRLKPTDNQYR